jgi:O-methyltransferase
MTNLYGTVKAVVPPLWRRKARLYAESARNSWRKDAAFYEINDRREFMRRSFAMLEFNGISGDYAEFGSWGGRTFGLAYQESTKGSVPRKLWAFDSFQGLPGQDGSDDDHPQWQKGSMSTSLDEFRLICRANGIPDTAYEVLPGYYDDTIGREDALPLRLPRDIALAYVDCDLYCSTRTVLQFLSKRMKHGMIVAFDDYYCYSATRFSGERRACIEFLDADTRFQFSPYVQYGWHGMSFVVEERALLSNARQP